MVLKTFLGGFPLYHTWESAHYLQGMHIDANYSKKLRKQKCKDFFLVSFKSASAISFLNLMETDGFITISLTLPAEIHLRYKSLISRKKSMFFSWWWLEQKKQPLDCIVREVKQKAVMMWRSWTPAHQLPSSSEIHILIHLFNCIISMNETHSWGVWTNGGQAAFYLCSV